MAQSMFPFIVDFRVFAVSPFVARHLTALDFSVLISYLLVVLGVGIYCAGRGKTSQDYFLAGQRIPWWAAGISIMATQVSSIGFMAIPAKAYATDWLYFGGVLTWPIVVPVVIACFIPFFRQLHVTTAYQYLEKRFGRAVCVYAALVFSLAQLARMAVVIYLPALALASTTDLDLVGCIVTMGVLATVYTVLGGMAAVVWTDVMQALVLIGGGILMLVWVALHIDGGPLAGILAAYDSNKLRVARFEWDGTAPVFWVVIAGNAFARLAELTSDQGVVQRYQSTPTERDAARALWVNAGLSVPWAFLMFALGTAIFVFYQQHPESLPPDFASDGIVPLFIAQQLPSGISGLIIAAVFASAMSSLDSSMHSTATVWTTDFYARWFPQASDPTRLKLARILVTLFGIFATCAAIAMTLVEIVSMWDFFIRVTGPLIGGLCGMFVLGIFFGRANAAGALIGAVTSGILIWAVDRFTDVHFLLFAPIGVISCVVAGYLASYLFAPPKQIEGLTYRTRHTNANA
jgi:SSS family transporter